MDKIEKNGQSETKWKIDKNEKNWKNGQNAKNGQN